MQGVSAQINKFIAKKAIVQVSLCNHYVTGGFFQRYSTDLLQKAIVQVSLCSHYVTYCAPRAEQ